MLAAQVGAAVARRYAHSVAEPRRVLIDWDYGASGIWWCSTKEEHEAPAPQGGYWTGTPPPGREERPRAWSDRLSEGLLDDLQAWNDAWDSVGPGTTGEVTRRALQERGRELAIRVQDELGTDGWEVLYRSDGRVHRVHRPGSWPARTWHEELLGYAPRDQQRAEEDGRVRQAILNRQKRADVDGSASTEP